MSPLFLACRAQSADILSILFEAGAILPEREKYSPLDKAIYLKNYDCFIILINHIQNIVPDEYHFTPLMSAINANFSEAVPILIQKCDPSYQAPNGKDALYLAFGSKNSKLLKCLLKLVLMLKELDFMVRMLLIGLHLLVLLN